MISKRERLGEAVVNSALWAAYGDALGFVSELTDEAGLRRRLRGKALEKTVPWSRLVGGKFGVFAKLPAGSYSDDTQLRLAAGRSVRADGVFDVEAFAKIELPVWLGYALGGGISTKAAAGSLAARNNNWFSNFFSRGKADYLSGGGNGAAMRIQPHVWSVCSLKNSSEVLRNVVRNAVTTHGHMRGIAGAGFHALCLAYALEEQALPSLDAMHEVAEELRAILTVVQTDPELSTFWLARWEEESALPLDQAVSDVQRELHDDIELVSQSFRRNASDVYFDASNAIGALSDESRGSGTKTALLAAALSWLRRDDGPDAVIQTAAQLIGSDTDTIATLAGALVGALAREEPVGDILDRDYIRREAQRLHSIARGEHTQSFVYPDLLTWQAPKSALDCVGTCEGKPCLAGLGLLEFEGRPVRSKGDEDVVWQLATLEFGQTVFCKRRNRLTRLASTSEPASTELKRRLIGAEEELFGAGNGRRVIDMDFYEDQSDSSAISKEDPPYTERSIDQLTSEAIKSGFDPSVIGRHLLEIAERESEIELGIAYVAVILKARKARLKANGTK